MSTNILVHEQAVDELLEDLGSVASVCPASRIGKVYKSISRIFEEEFRGGKVTNAQFQILAHIKMLDGPGCSELASHIGSDPSTVSRIVDTLEQKGYVTSKQGKDKRTQRYSLSRKGVTAVKEGLRNWKNAYGRVVDQVGEKRWAQMQKLLSAFPQ
ncbi:MAG: MarR family transcriptional regulator [Spirochaetaceae bacterium]|nr:MAG: MarR family transcriptional regulator [Spirochaetaceae bacterium]